MAALEYHWIATSFPPCVSDTHLFLVGSTISQLPISTGVIPSLTSLSSTVASEPEIPSEARRKGLQKHQAVFSLDFDTWEELIEVFDIKECLIPHREEDEEIRQANRSG